MALTLERTMPLADKDPESLIKSIVPSIRTDNVRVALDHGSERARFEIYTSGC